VTRLTQRGRAPRADVEGPGSHLVDDGYYDNYGISSLVQWLDKELRTNQDIEEVLIIEVRGSPSAPAYTFDDADACPPKPSTGAEERRSSPSWFYQYTAPLRTVLGVRRTGQRAHNDLELDLLVDKWDEQDKANEQDKQGGREPHRVEITRALFEFDGPRPPLSWHLSDCHKERIKENWVEDEHAKGKLPGVATTILTVAAMHAMYLTIRYSHLAGLVLSDRGPRPPRGNPTNVGVRARLMRLLIGKLEALAG
jgi:hypothetical protein